MENKLLFETWLRIPPPQWTRSRRKLRLLSIVRKIGFTSDFHNTCHIVFILRVYELTRMAGRGGEDGGGVTAPQTVFKISRGSTLTDIQTRHRDIILFETSGRFIHGRKKRVFLTRHDNEFQLFFLATEPGTAKNIICSYIWWIRFLCPTLTIPRAQRYHITLKTWGQPYVPTCLGHFQN